MKQHFYFFDFARVVAALCVLLVHARVEILTPYSYLPPESQTLFTKTFIAFCSMGTDGVIVFFLLSGFLVGGRNMERLLRGEGSAKDFAVGRLCRIFPPLIAALVLSTVQKMITGEPFSWMNLVGNLCCMQELFVSPEMPVLWTISYEVFFYIMIFAFICLRDNNKFAWGLLALSAVCIALMKFRLWFWIPLMVGMLMYFLRNRIGKHRKIFILALVVSAIAIVCEKISNVDGGMHLLPSWISYTSVVIIETFGFAVVLTYLSGLKAENGWPMKIEQFGNSFAKISYSLFLCHYPLLKLAHWVLGRSYGFDGVGIAVLVVVCSICIVFAYLFYWIAEKHTANWSKKILAVL